MIFVLLCNLFLAVTVSLVVQTGSTTAAKCGHCSYLAYEDYVCGSDDKTYNNIVALGCQSLCNPDLKMAYKGPCRIGVIAREKRQLSRGCGGLCICTADYTPVCGSNGITYGNSCQLNCQARCTPGLRLVRRGECM